MNIIDFSDKLFSAKLFDKMSVFQFMFNIK